MFTRIGAAAYKKDLHNTIALLQELGNPQQHFKSIHIAGTNGKGSTSHMMAAIMQKHGYKTGLYTSPHLVDFRERIKINGEWISQEFIIDFVARIQPSIEAISPSFFEVTVAMAFEWFAQQQVDIAIIETGLGGRLDSTNIITPELSIITNIGWDHMNLLGNTLPEIAFEKAGIIKPYIPVVIGETLPETKPVFEEKANSTGSPIYFSEQAFTIVHTSLQPQQLQLELQDSRNGETVDVATDLPGIYQQYNLRTVLKATDVLTASGWPLNKATIQEALLQVQPLTGLHGRWEVLRQSPYVVLDVAHNPQGIEQVLAQLQQLQSDNSKRKIHWVMGMVHDKDISKVLSLLPAAFTYYFTQAHIPRAMPYLQMQEQALQKGLAGNAYPDVNTALQAALAKANDEDIIMVCGSVFVVGEVNKEWVSSTLA